MAIRRFLERDVTQVAELHRRVFDVAPQSSPELLRAYRRYFGDVFLQDGETQRLSLVCEDERGRISGFLGAVPRRLASGGEQLLGAVSSQFVVDARDRSNLVGVKLLQEFFRGPQDVSIADEARGHAARIWEGLGGSTSALYSTHWIRPLRPFELAASVLRSRPDTARFAPRPRALVRAIDRLARRLVPRVEPRPTPRVEGEAAPVDAFVRHLPGLVGRDVLRPVHDERSLGWALSRACGGAGAPPVQSVLVRSARGDVVGVYVFRAEPDGIGDVLHVSALPAFQADVLEHMFHRAYRDGALAMAGRIEPGLMQALSDAQALFHRRGPRMLVHARRPEHAMAFDAGRAVFSRLEGEFCLRFTPP
jgi:hypothetical protein